MPRRAHTDSGTGEICPLCGGTGRVASPGTDDDSTQVCPVCRGLGHVAPARPRPTSRPRQDNDPERAARAAATAARMPPRVREAQYRNTVAAIGTQAESLRDVFTGADIDPAAATLYRSLVNDIAVLATHPDQVAAASTRAAARAVRLARPDGWGLPADTAKRVARILNQIIAALDSLLSLAP